MVPYRCCLSSTDVVVVAAAAVAVAAALTHPAATSIVASCTSSSFPYSRVERTNDRAVAELTVSKVYDNRTCGIVERKLPDFHVGKADCRKTIRYT